MTLSENIRILVDMVFDANPNVVFTTEGLSNEILRITGEYYSSKQVYHSIKDLSYGNHAYTRDCNSKPYFYEKM